MLQGAHSKRATSVDLRYAPEFILRFAAWPTNDRYLRIPAGWNRREADIEIGSSGATRLRDRQRRPQDAVSSDQV